MASKLYAAVATMVGYIIGAGMLGIPFAVAKSGYITGLITIIGIGIGVMFLNLFLGEVVLRTKEKHQLTGYAEKYLGKTGKVLMVFVMVTGVYGALVAYILKEGQFLHALFGGIFGGTPFTYSLIFFAIGTYLIYRGIKAIEKGEALLVTLLFLIIAILLVTSFKHISFDNLTGFNPGMFLIPFGVILFAFNASGAIPEIVLELKKNKKLVKKAIIIGSTIPIIIYVIFTALVIGVTGAATTDGAILGVAQQVGGFVMLAGTLLGIIVLATSFMAVGLALKEMLMFDFKWKPVTAAMTTCFGALAITMTILFLGIENAFYKVLDLTGSIEVPLAAILVILMARKAKKEGDRKPEYSMNYLGVIGTIIILIFLTAFLNLFFSF